MNSFNNNEEHRYNEDLEYSCRKHAEYYSNTHFRTGIRTCTSRKCQRNVAEDECQGSHQNRAQTNLRCFDGSLHDIHAIINTDFRVLDDQDGVLRSQPDDGQECPYRCPCSTRKLIPDSSEQGVGMTKTAMIDVGGGFRAIFGCGVMDRMLEDGIDVDMCYGVSAGAANMTSFIARQHGRNHTFYTKYAFRKEYASAESFFKNHNFANLDYIYGTLSNHDGENPLDFAAFEANGTGFTVVACNAEDGSTKYFDKSRVRFDDFDIIKASSAVPVACEPYVVDGVPYFDGGIADPVPVQKALEDGYDRVILILSRLRDEVRKQQKDLAPARILERSHPAAAEKLRMRYKTYNDELELAKHYEAEGRVLILAPEDLYGLNTLKKNFEGLEMMYRKGYAAAEAIPAFLQA